ncbi:uncharacterized protein LOC123501325 isoform X2 [Portunus trituberculatus]|nr:uncharacterized protein LOC123501325 isoform X2 [Portunus trituberculatus]
MILLLVVMSCLVSLTVGATKWATNGRDDNALMLTLFGAIVFIFVVMGIAITLCAEPFNRQSQNLPFSDRPPKYRDTWRRQHLESCSQATDTIPGVASLDTQRERSDTNFSRLDVRSLFHSLAIPGVHHSSRRNTSASVINEHMRHQLEISGRPARANTAPACDEGLPTYEEAMNR